MRISLAARTSMVSPKMARMAVGRQLWFTNEPTRNRPERATELPGRRPVRTKSEVSNWCALASKISFTALRSTLRLGRAPEHVLSSAASAVKEGSVGGVRPPSPQSRKNAAWAWSEHRSNFRTVASNKLPDFATENALFRNNTSPAATSLIATKPRPLPSTSWTVTGPTKSATPASAPGSRAASAAKSKLPSSASLPTPPPCPSAAIDFASTPAPAHARARARASANAPPHAGKREARAQRKRRRYGSRRQEAA
mmetsp:Transcript_18456/g.50732  ORF Transcript_18456/g.50732 Transcript_18456/m.50732 type:complete len:254 (+) Transcript_18456:855-1616(+)